MGMITNKLTGVITKSTNENVMTRANTVYDMNAGDTKSSVSVDPLFHKQGSDKRLLRIPGQCQATIRYKLPRIKIIKIANNHQ